MCVDLVIQFWKTDLCKLGGGGGTLSDRITAFLINNCQIYQFFTWVIRKKLSNIFGFVTHVVDWAQNTS